MLKSEVIGTKLRPHYTMPHGSGGHDISHVERMIARGPRIAEVTGLVFDHDEFAAAVWLHNIDRGAAVRGVSDIASLEQIVRIQLTETDFDNAAKDRIVDAVLQHNKKDDAPGDSTLLQAVRIADKLDRLGPLGVLSAAAFRGSELPLYDPKQPFGYTSTAEGETMKTVYIDLFRVMEWVGMLPSDQARSLIDREDVTAFISFVRSLGREIARQCNVPNKIEDDIKKALGPFYDRYANANAQF